LPFRKLDAENFKLQWAVGGHYILILIGIDSFTAREFEADVPICRSALKMVMLGQLMFVGKVPVLASVLKDDLSRFSCVKFTV
jgi:hypothetical protein